MTNLLLPMPLVLSLLVMIARSDPSEYDKVIDVVESDAYRIIPLGEKGG